MLCYRYKWQMIVEKDSATKSKRQNLKGDLIAHVLQFSAWIFSVGFQGSGYPAAVWIFQWWKLPHEKVHSIIRKIYLIERFHHKNIFPHNFSPSDLVLLSKSSRIVSIYFHIAFRVSEDGCHSFCKNCTFSPVSWLLWDSLQFSKCLLAVVPW